MPSYLFMTSLAAPALQAAAKPVALNPPVFGPRIIIGLVGVLLAVLVSGLNEMVTKVALADIRGALYIGFDGWGLRKRLVLLALPLVDIRPE